MKRNLTVLSIVFLCIPLGAFAFSNGANSSRITYSGHATTTAIQLFTTSMPAASSDDFSVATSSADVIITGAIASTTYSDVITNNYGSGSILYSCSVVVFSTSSPYTMSSVDPSIATVDHSGTVTYVSDGMALFNITSGRRTKQASCPERRTVNAFTKVTAGYVSSSTVANLMIKSVADRIQGLVPSSDTTDIYTSMNDGAHIYVRNPDAFTNAIATTTTLDLTALPSWGPLDMTGSGILVAPDIMISASHICPITSDQSGDEYFTDYSNSTYARAVISRSFIPNGDLCVIRLASDVPASIHPAKVFPPDIFFNKVTLAAIFVKGIPLMATNQFRTIGIGIMYNAQPSYVNYYIATSSSSIFSPWYYQPRGGDSGTPCFSAVNGQLVAVGTWWFSSGCSNITMDESAINAAMTSLGSPYQLTPVDLSPYPSF